MEREGDQKKAKKFGHNLWMNPKEGFDFSFFEISHFLLVSNIQNNFIPNRNQ